MQTIGVAGFASLIALIATNAMQLLKPLIELIPGILLAKYREAHDALLQLVTWGVNFGLLLIAAHFATSIFTGVPWWVLLLSATGQTLAGHVTYRNALRGKIDAPPPGTITFDPPPLAGTSINVSYPMASTDGMAGNANTPLTSPPDISTQYPSEQARIPLVPRQ